MKEWPEGNQAVHFTEIVLDLREAVDFAYTLKRKNEGRDIPWNGLNFGKDELVKDYTPEERLSTHQLAYDLEERGIDPLNIILGIGVRLGIELGRRMERDNPVTSRQT